MRCFWRDNNIRYTDKRRPLMVIFLSYIHRGLLHHLPQERERLLFPAVRVVMDLHPDYQRRGIILSPQIYQYCQLHRRQHRQDQGPHPLPPDQQYQGPYQQSLSKQGPEGLTIGELPQCCRFTGPGKKLPVGDNFRGPSASMGQLGAIGKRTGAQQLEGK